jgi:putative ABC transport system ATP-binding protein
MIVVDAKGIKKTYHLKHGLVAALNPIDLQVNSGDMLAIMGPSGSGKSTLMHILGCLEKPTEGQYLLNGEDISRLDDRSLSLLRATQIGFVFQSFNLIHHLNVIENVQLPFLYNQEKNSSRAAVMNAIERVGLSHRLHHLPNELSGGEAQRVAIARALVVNPLLILADEPTGNLDFETSSSILSLFQSLHVEGVTIIIVTHDEYVAKHCKHLIHMRDGLIVEGQKRDGT